MNKLVTDFIYSLILLAGVYLVSYAAGTPGGQPLAAFIGGGCIGFITPRFTNPRKDNN